MHLYNHNENSKQSPEQRLNAAKARFIKNVKFISGTIVQHKKSPIKRDISRVINNINVSSYVDLSVNQGICQLRVSPILKFFKSNLHKTYGLQEYRDTRKPVIFFGCYKKQNIDYNALFSHKSLVVIVWGGSDILQLKCRKHILRHVKHSGNIKHIAISRFIAKDLEKLNIPYKYLPICPTNRDAFRPTPLGNSVYAYTSHTRKDIYGNDLINDVAKKLVTHGINVMSCTHFDNSYDSMQRVYNQCFCGLRLTKHDGLSNTVMELGLTGRYCFWNSIAPNAIPWSTIDGIVEKILELRSSIGTINASLAKATKDFLNIDNAWLTTDFYKDNNVAT